MQRYIAKTAFENEHNCVLLDMNTLEVIFIPNKHNNFFFKITDLGHK